MADMALSGGHAGILFLTERVSVAHRFFKSINGRSVLAAVRTEVPPIAKTDSVEYGTNSHVVQAEALRAALQNPCTIDAVVRGLCFLTTDQAMQAFLACCDLLAFGTTITPSKMRVYLMIHIRAKTDFLKACCMLMAGAAAKGICVSQAPSWFPAAEAVFSTLIEESFCLSDLAEEMHPTVAAIFARELAVRCRASKDKWPWAYCDYATSGCATVHASVWRAGMVHVDPGVRMVTASAYAMLVANEGSTAYANRDAWKLCRDILMQHLNCIGDELPFPPNIYATRLCDRYACPIAGFFRAFTDTVGVLGMVSMDCWHRVLGRYNRSVDGWHLGHLPVLATDVEYGAESRLFLRHEKSTFPGAYVAALLQAPRTESGISRDETAKLVHFVGLLGYPWRAAFSTGVSVACRNATFATGGFLRAYAQQSVCNFFAPLGSESRLAGGLGMAMKMRETAHAAIAHEHFMRSQTGETPECDNVCRSNGRLRLVNTAFDIDHIVEGITACGPQGVLIGNDCTFSGGRTDRAKWGWNSLSMETLNRVLPMLKDSNGKLFVVTRIPVVAENTLGGAGATPDTWTFVVFNRDTFVHPFSLMETHAEFARLVICEDGHGTDKCVSCFDIARLMAVSAALFPSGEKTSSVFQTIATRVFESRAPHPLSCEQCMATRALYGTGTGVQGTFGKKTLLPLRLSSFASVCGTDFVPQEIMQKVQDEAAVDADIARARKIANVWRVLLLVGTRFQLSFDMVDEIVKAACIITCPPIVLAGKVCLSAIMARSHDAGEVFCCYGKIERNYMPDGCNAVHTMDRVILLNSLFVATGTTLEALDYLVWLPIVCRPLLPLSALAHLSLLIFCLYQIVNENNQSLLFPIALAIQTPLLLHKKEEQKKIKGG